MPGSALVRPLALLVLTASLALGLGRPAAAHEGDGVVTIEQREPAGPASLRYVVRLTWSLDGHPATMAWLTATPVDSLGTRGTPVVLSPVDLDGRYTGTVVFPTTGTWTVEFGSQLPPTKVTIVEQVVG